MYNFVDTIENPGGNSLPSEAVSIDGQFIEEAIKGYRTLYTKGREGLAAELETVATGSAHGERVKYSRYPSRTITVGFQLLAESSEAFREKFNHLCNLLSMDEADFVFNDEKDKFFVGTPILSIEVQPGRNTVTGEWKIYCADPFKYSVEPVTVYPSTTEGNTAQFVLNYEGNVPAKPTLVAEFAGALEGGNYSDDGDCGFVAFIDQDENIVQLGNPEAIDLDAYTAAGQLVNKTFTSYDVPAGETSWNNTAFTTWGNKKVDGGNAIGSIKDTYWANGKGQTLSFTKPTYGSNSGWHGPILWKELPGGAINFDLSLVHRLCCSASGQLGTFEVGLYNVEGTTYKMVAGIVIEKSASGSNATVRYIVNGRSVGTQSIDLSYCNTNFGYCNRTAIYTTKYYYKTVKAKKKKKKKKYSRKVFKGYKYTQSNLNTSIKKSGSQVTFKVGNLAAKTYTDSDIDLIPVHRLSMHFGKNGTTTPLHTNAVSSVRFTRNPSASFLDIPNVFTAGDIVEANCTDATVFLRHEGTEEGYLAPMYGALGNDWEDFELTNGINIINAVWSDWVNPNYTPKLSIVFNTRYI